jgi:hypothetical protein
MCSSTASSADVCRGPHIRKVCVPFHALEQGVQNGQGFRGTALPLSFSLLTFSGWMLACVLGRRRVLNKRRRGTAALDFHPARDR